MFGYVRPADGHLTAEDKSRFQAAYCGLCRSLGRRYGLTARMILNYDLAFLAMLLSREPECLTAHCRCPAHPIRGCDALEGQDAFDTAADLSVILTWWQLKDGVADHGFFRGLPARLAALVLTPAYKKAAAARPEFARMVAACLDELHKLERERCPSLDRPADTFARILQAAAPDTGDDHRNRALSQTLYHVGRWIYLIDAWDDLEEDARTGSYNPIDARYQGRGKEHLQDVRTTLNHSRSLAACAYELAKAERWDGILSNILYLGLPAVEELVLAGRWQRKRKLINIGE